MIYVIGGKSMNGANAHYNVFKLYQLETVPIIPTVNNPPPKWTDHNVGFVSSAGQSEVTSGREGALLLFPGDARVRGIAQYHKNQVQDQNQEQKKEEEKGKENEKENDKGIVNDKGKEKEKENEKEKEKEKEKRKEKEKGKDKEKGKGKESDKGKEKEKEKEKENEQNLYHNQKLITDLGTVPGDEHWENKLVMISGHNSIWMKSNFTNPYGTTFDDTWIYQHATDKDTFRKRFKRISDFTRPGPQRAFAGGQVLRNRVIVFGGKFEEKSYNDLHILKLDPSDSPSPFEDLHPNIPLMVTLSVTPEKLEKEKIVLKETDKKPEISDSEKGKEPEKLEKGKEPENTEKGKEPETTEKGKEPEKNRKVYSTR